MTRSDSKVLAELHASGLSHAEIARRLGVSRQAVHQRLGKVKHRSAPVNAKLTTAKVREARRLRSKAWTMERLAERYGVAVSTIKAAVNGATWVEVDEPLPGPVSFRPGNAKLTEARVRAARKAWAKGARCADLARKYGVSPRGMLAALRGETWAGVEREPT